MSIHKAEVSIAAPIDVVWEALTCGEFSAWPSFLAVTTSDDVLGEGTEVETRLNLPVAKGLVISRVVTCDQNSRIATSLVRTEGLPVKTEVADTFIDVSQDSTAAFTQVDVKLCLEFSGLRARLIRGFIEPLIQLQLQPNIAAAGDQLAANYSALRPN